MDYKEHHKLNQEFIERFPLEKLKDMTIEQYTNLDTWGLSLCANNNYHGSYAQDEMGHSDDDIDTIFDGDPSAYWNID